MSALHGKARQTLIWNARDAGSSSVTCGANLGIDIVHDCKYRDAAKTTNQESDVVWYDARLPGA